MPDLNFYNELRNKFNKDYPRQFWDWLIQQDIQRPWWLYIGGDFSKKDYLNQLYRQYKAPTKPTELVGQEATKHIESKIVKHPQTGEDVILFEGNEYLQPQLESLGWTPKTSDTGVRYFSRPETGKPGSEKLPTYTVSYGDQKMAFPAMQDALAWAQFLQGQREFDIGLKLKEAEEQKKLEMQQLATKQDISRMRSFEMQQSLRSPWDYMGKTPNQGALDFETMREHLIESVRPESRSWISQYVKSVANPFAEQTSRRSDDDYAMLQDEAKRTKIAADRVRAKLKNPNDSLTPPDLYSADMAENTEAGAARRILNAEKIVNQRLMEMDADRARGILAAQTGAGVPGGERAEQAYWATPRATATGNYVVGQPGAPVQRTPLTPEIPEWLQRASGLKGRVPEKRSASDILAPSGQSWAQMTPQQQGMYAGLVDWAGKKSFEDIMGEVAMQLPRTPSLPRSWKAFEQV